MENINQEEGYCSGPGIRGWGLNLDRKGSHGERGMGIPETVG
jgi:hypothetical protein